MVDSVTFGDVTTSSTVLANATGYNAPTVTSDGKTLPHWLAILWEAVLECDAALEAVGPSLVATSSSSVAVGSGSKTFTVGAGKSFTAGLFVTAARTSDPSATYMAGQVTAYSGGDLTISVPADGYAGTGTFTDWTIGLGGRRGAQGPAGNDGADGDLTEAGADLIYTRQDREGVAGGVATLDGSAKIPADQMPITVAAYQGNWNASTNSPDLSGLTPSTGDFYRVSTAGSTSLGGVSDWKVGDLAVYNGSSWEKWDFTPNPWSADQDPNGFGVDGPVPKARAGKRTVTGSTTTTDADINGVVYYNSASAGNVTLHAPGAGLSGDGTEFIVIAQKGAGQATAVAGTGTIRYRSGAGPKTLGQYASLTCHFDGTDWWVEGGVP